MSGASSVLITRASVLATRDWRRAIVGVYSPFAFVDVAEVWSARSVELLASPADELERDGAGPCSADCVTATGEG